METSEEFLDRSITIACVFPDGAAHASEAFGIPASRQIGSAAVFEWDAGKEGHEIHVTEDSLRERIAKHPRVTFTITREAPRVTPPERTGDEEDPLASEPRGRGVPIVSVVEVDLASVILGSKRSASARFGAVLSSFETETETETETFAGLETRRVNPSVPLALFGFESCVFSVRLDAFDEGFDARDQSGKTEIDGRLFLPRGLALATEPFAVTVEAALSLPDAPASAAQLETCEPVCVHVQWAGLPIATVAERRERPIEWNSKTSRFPSNRSNFVSCDDVSGSGSATVSEKPRACATAAKNETVHEMGAQMRTRFVSFDASVFRFGRDVPSDRYPRGMRDVCAEKIRLRVYDRLPRTPPAASEGDSESRTRGNADGPSEEETPDSDSIKTEEADFEFPHFPEGASYGFASFDVGEFCALSNAPVKPKTHKLAMEAVLLPCAMSSSVPASWRTRPGRFIEAGSTVRVALEMAVHPCEKPVSAGEVGAAETSKEEASANAEPEPEPEPEPETDGIAAKNATNVESSPRVPRMADGDAEETRAEEDKKKKNDSETRFPFVRAAMTFPSDDASLFREIVRKVRETNAKAFGVTDPSIVKDDARLRFELSLLKLTAAQSSDPGFHAITGYHLVAGNVRQIVVEGTVVALESVARIFAETRRRRFEKARDERETNSDRFWTVMNDSVRYGARLYAADADDSRSGAAAELLGIRLRESIETIMSEASTHAGLAVRPDARECLRKVTALATEGTKARQARDASLFPDFSQLWTLDRTFGAALIDDDVSAEAPESRRAVEFRRGSRFGVSEGTRSIEEKEKTRAFPSLDGDASVRANEPASTPSGDSMNDPAKKTKRAARPPLTFENAEYVAHLERTRLARETRNVHERHETFLAELAGTDAAIKKRSEWSEWNVIRPPRDVFLTELETARRHATASFTPEPRVFAEKHRTHSMPFRWPVAHVASERRVPVHERLPSSRIEELREAWQEPSRAHWNRFGRDSFASGYFPGGALDSIVAKASERRGAEVKPSLKPFETRFRGLEGFDGNARERSLWEKPEATATAKGRGDAAWKSKPWRDARAPRSEKPAQVDKQRGVLHDKPRKKGLMGACVKGASKPYPHSMFLDEPPFDSRGVSLEETFFSTLRRSGDFKFGAGIVSSREDPATFIAGRDFVRHNVGDRRLKHTGRTAGVGEVAPPRTRAQGRRA